MGIKIKSDIVVNKNGTDLGTLEELFPTILYDNESGSNGAITLSENVANFKYIEIFYKSNDNYYNSVKIYKPNEKIASLSCWYTFTSEVGLYLKTKAVYISGTSISIVVKNSNKYAYGETSFSSGGTISKNENNYIYITRVLGYK